MVAWIADHFVLIIVLIVLAVLARKGFAWLQRHGSRDGGPLTQKSFCNKCGWKGQSAKVKGACDHCGSRNITLCTT